MSSPFHDLVGAKATEGDAINNCDQVLKSFSSHYVLSELISFGAIFVYVNVEIKVKVDLN